MANRPGIIISKIEKKTGIMIDMAIPADINVTEKEAQNEGSTRVCVQ